MSDTTTTTEAPWHAKVPTGTRGLTILASALIGIGLFGGGLWAATMPLASATIATGFVAADGRNVKVQHLEGGMVQAINVAEGDRVNAGETLVKLDTVRAGALLNRLSNQQAGLIARIARLEAERDQAAVLITPEALDMDRFGGLYDEQQREFAARLQRHNAEIAILQQRIAALGDGIAGLESQQTATREQLKVVTAETDRKLVLLKRGNTRRSEYTDLLRSQSDLVGRAGTVESQIASSRTQILEVREQIERSISQRVETAVVGLNEARVQLADMSEQIRAARDVLERSTVVAPTDGVVVQLLTNTAGAVIRPGETVLELLPSGESRIVEARVQVQDRDTVFVGQSVNLVFSALDRRTTPEVPGEMLYLSADRLTDERSQESYFLARIRIDAEKAGTAIMEKVAPGMPVEVYFLNQPRTFIEYVFKPIRDSFRRAFTER